MGENQRASNGSPRTSERVAADPTRQAPATTTPDGHVRYAFQLPRSLLRDLKRAALECDECASELVRRWVEAGLNGDFDDLRLPMRQRNGPMSQFPVNMTEAMRQALRDRCVEEDQSAAQLLRRWVSCGLAGMHATPDA